MDRFRMEDNPLTPEFQVPVLTHPERFEEKPYTPALPGPDEVQIRVADCGVCGSDIHAFHGEHPFMPPPLILGHEFSGTIQDVGKNVKDVKPGDRVTVEPVLTCGECINCLNGKYNVCLKRKVIGCQSTGAFSRVFNVPSERVIPLPDSVSFEAGAVVEPLAVGVHAIRRARIQPDTKVLVLGAGTIGLLTATVAMALGGKPVLIADRIRSRLEIARQLGIPETVDFSKEDLVEKSRKVFGANGPDLLVDCVGGKGNAFDTILKIARPGTRVLAVGIFEPNVTIPNLVNLVENELEVIGSSIYRKEDFEEAVELIADGRVDATRLITHRYPLSRVSEAFAMTARPDADYVKVMIRVGGGEG